MFLTRLGFGSKVVVTGDVTQVDLPREQASGLIQVQDILGAIDGIAFVRFGARGRRPAQARPADRRGVQAPRGGDRHAAAEVSGDGRDRGRRTAAASRSTRRPRRRSRATVLAAEGVDDGELGLAFVGPDEIRALKREHSGIDEATDVALVPDRRPRRRCRTACRGSSATSCSARRSSARRGARRSSTPSCTCSATTTAPRWRRARRRSRDERSPRRAVDPRELQLRVRGRHPRAAHAAEHADPLPGRGRRARRRGRGRRHAARADRAAARDRVRPRSPR